MLVKNWILRTLVALSAVGFAGPALATPIVVGSTVHGFARDSDGGVKDGVGDAVNTSVVLVRNQSSTEERGIMEYDVSGLSGPVASATLDIEATSVFGTLPRTIEVRGFVGDGSLTASDFGLGALLTTFSLTGDGLYSADVTAFVNQRITDTDQWAGIQFVDITEEQSLGSRYDPLFGQFVLPAARRRDGYSGADFARHAGPRPRRARIQTQGLTGIIETREPAWRGLSLLCTSNLRAGSPGEPVLSIGAEL